jgi:integrase
MLVDANGRPRYWATHWMVRRSTALAASSLVEYLRPVERLYASVTDYLGTDCLDELLANADIKRIDQCLEHFFSTLRDEQLRTGIPKFSTWSQATGFVRFCLDDIVHRSSVGERRRAQLQSLRSLEFLADRLKTGPRRPRRQNVRSLPASVVEDLYELLWPDSKRNPFRSTPNRHRNFVLFLLYLHQGLRRAEPLLFPVDAVHSEIDGRTKRLRYWMNVTWNPYEDDERRSASPSIKTSWSFRQIPVAENVASAVANYAANYRGRQRHSYLFPSQERSPLSSKTVNQMFQTVSRHLSKAAATDLWNRHRETWISPHDLRHTCAAMRLHQIVAAGEQLEVAVEMLRGFFGWSPKSDMPRLYARSFFDERLASVWNADFDARVDLLRRQR